MPRFALAFLIVGFVSAFFAFAGVSASTPDIARWLVIGCAVGFIVSVGLSASTSRHAPR